MFECRLGVESVGVENGFVVCWIEKRVCRVMRCETGFVECWGGERVCRMLWWRISSLDTKLRRCLVRA